MEHTRSLLIEAQLRIAHDKIMQAQQKIDNEDLQEQRLLEQALDAIDSARTSLTQWGQYTFMNE